MRWYSSNCDCACTGPATSANAIMHAAARISPPYVFREGRSGDRAFDMVGVALVVEPADLDLVPLGAALQAEGEHGIARHRLTDFTRDHGFAVELDRDVLDEMRLPLAAHLLLRGHGMAHQHAYVDEVALLTRPHF